MESPERISAADNCPVGGDDVEACGGDGDDFEFSFVRIPEAGPAIAADDIFSDGKIRPIYPVFNRDLLLVDRHNFDEKGSGSESGSKPIRVPLRRLFIEEEKEQASFSSASSLISSSSSSSSASSSMDELDAIPPGTYCVWTPPASKSSRCKKSCSAGPSSAAAGLRWRLRDLVVGRSQSDGRARFVFIPIREEEEDDDREGGAADSKKEAENKSNNNDNKLGMKKLFLGKKLLSGKKSSAAEVDVGTAQPRMFDGHHGQNFGKAAGSSSARRSYLPYKQDLVAFFNSVNARSQPQS